MNSTIYNEQQIGTIADSEAYNLIANVLIDQSYNDGSFAVLPETQAISDTTPFSTSDEIDLPYLSLRDKITAKTAEMYLRFAERLSNQSPEWLNATFRPIAKDVMESDHKIRTASIGLGVVATQVASKTRLPIVAVPKTGAYVLEHTQSAPLTALAAGGMNLLISGAVGEFATQALIKYPRSIEVISKKFPKTIDFFQKGLPGMKTIQEKQNEKSNGISAKRILKGSIVHIRRAFSGMAIDPGTFVATGYTLGYDEKEMRKVNLRVGLDTSLLVGGIAWKLADYVNGMVDNGELQKVETIQSWIGNTKNWWAIAGLLMATGYIGNKLKSRKEDVSNA